MTSSNERPDRKDTKMLATRVSPALSNAVRHFAVDASSTVEAIAAVALYEYLERNSGLPLGLERPSLIAKKRGPKVGG